MPCVNKVMAPHDKQMKLSAFFLERNLVNWSDLTKHNRRVIMYWKTFPTLTDISRLMWPGPDSKQTPNFTTDPVPLV